MWPIYALSDTGVNQREAREGDQGSMIVLGINAYHGDVSAVLLRDGQLVAAVEEERFRRVKHWAGFPRDQKHVDILIYGKPVFTTGEGFGPGFRLWVGFNELTLSPLSMGHD
jgi:hypothetical protein